MKKENKAPYCPTCKHFWYCDWEKVVYTKIMDKPCEDYKLCKLTDDNDNSVDKNQNIILK